MTILAAWAERPKAFVDALVEEALDRIELEARDRGFVCELAFGVVRHRNTLDELGDCFLSFPIDKASPGLRTALHLGLYQLIYLGTPPHAAVSATCDALERSRRSYGRGHVESSERDGAICNALLRRVADGLEKLEGDPDDETDDPERELDESIIRVRDGYVRVRGHELPEEDQYDAARIAFRYSHPTELVRIWQERYDQATLRQIFDHDNRPPALFLHVRSDVSPDLVARKLEMKSINFVQDPDESRRFKIANGGAVPRIPGFDNGEFWVQDRTANSLARMLPQREGGSLLDLCSAPGGKLATYLDRGPLGSVFATDVSEKKLVRVAENLGRLRFAGVDITFDEVDADPDHVRFDRRFDQIVVDAPCSNTGVFARRHEARWRFVPEILRGLEAKQRGLLRCAVRHLEPGGDLLYTTCSIEPKENSGIAHDIVRQTMDLDLVEEREVLPGENGGDGGYAARFIRKPSGS